MEYQVLARKWRPQRFADLVGQNHISQALSHALAHQRLHHAYLFTGTRGVGKTTIARILAKCLNCERGISATPCGECQTCKAIEAGRFIDLLEIDAASKTKVEDTRELLENVMYAPTQGRYKVYLIDEVHMLSGHSFNALLKTLEEPPPHVKFLLATTDPQKLPITVLSRCLQFQLKQLSPELLAPHLAHILQQEQVHFEAEALDLIAHAAKGSARDALSLLDQAIASGDGQVTFSAVSDMLGIQGQQLILPLAKHILSQQVSEALAVTRKLAELAADFDYVLEQLIILFHDLSIKQLANDFPINNPFAAEAEMQALLPLCDAQDLQLCYQIALLAKRDLTLAPTAAIGFEMALLRMIAFKVGAAFPMKTTAPQKNNNAPNITAPALKKPEPTPTPPPTEAKKASIAAKPHSQDPPWHELLPQLGLTAFAKALAEHLLFERREQDHYYFSLEEKHAPMLQERHRQKIAAALTEYFAKPIALTIQIGRSQQSQASLIEQRNQQHQQTQQEALNTFKQDKTLQKALNQFDAQLMAETLTTHDSH